MFIIVFRCCRRYKILEIKSITNCSIVHANTYSEKASEAHTFDLNPDLIIKIKKLMV